MSDPGISPIDDFDAEARAQDTIDDERVVEDEEDPDLEGLETVTNDAVAGDTVTPQAGDGTADGPTGGAPREGAPDEWEHDDVAQMTDFGNDLGTRPL
jgi:hypothetical protein